MDSIGERLRQERLRRGWDIAQIAEATKINSYMLEAIEADDLERLPGSFFTRSFIRQYARALGLEEDEFEPELKRLAEQEEPPAHEVGAPRMDYTVAPVPAARRKRPGHSLGAAAAFVLIMAACSGIYVLWERTRQPAAEATTPKPAVTKHPAAPAPAPTPAPPAPATPPSEPSTAPPGATPATSPATTAAAPAPADITKSSVPPDELPAVRLEIRAKEEVWVRVVGDRTLLYEGTLKAGQRLRTDGSAYLRARLGRSEGVELTWNGHKIGEAGVPGQPLTVEFTAQRFRVVPPAPPPSEQTPDEP